MVSKDGDFILEERDSELRPKSLIRSTDPVSGDPDIDIIIAMPHPPVFAPDNTFGDALLHITKEFAKNRYRQVSFHASLSFNRALINDTGLPYCPLTPGALVNTAGRQWDYQASPDLTKILREEVEEHFNNYENKLFDKNTIPLYLFLSGAGTGKSRNATELDKAVYKCFDVLISKRGMSFWHRGFGIHSFSM